MSLPGTRTIWEEGHESGREIVALGVALALTLACLDLTVTGRISLLFDLCFVLLCAGLALAVRLDDVFSVGVLPPLLMLATFALLAMSRSEAIATRSDGLVAAVVYGLAHHVLALALGYAATLGILAQRRRVAGLRAQAITRTGRGPRLRV